MLICSSAHIFSKSAEDARSNRYKGPFWRGILGDLPPFFLQNGPFEAKIAPSDPQNRVNWGAIGGKYGCARLFSPLTAAIKAGGLAADKACPEPALRPKNPYISDA